ncbi:MAG: sulfatase-like hydrolase/transferase [Caldilineaceae bacterium]
MNNKPNLIYILADDMGYGDLSCLNENSKIRTGHLDRLAAAGMIFRDAHATSAVCTPSRSILTGRYNWRSALKQGVTWGYSPAAGAGAHDRGVVLAATWLSHWLRGQLAFGLGMGEKWLGGRRCGFQPAYCTRPYQCRL